MFYAIVVAFINGENVELKGCCQFRISFLSFNAWFNFVTVVSVSGFKTEFIFMHDVPGSLHNLQNQGSSSVVRCYEMYKICKLVVSGKNRNECLQCFNNPIVQVFYNLIIQN